MAGGFHPHAHLHSLELQVAVKLLGLSIAVLQLLLTAFSAASVDPSDLLKARMSIL